MPKKREDPAQWLPEKELPDEQCSVLQFWSRHNQRIAQYRKFRAPETTIPGYTATIKAIEEELKDRPITTMDAYDIWDAVVSVRGRINAQGEYVPYSVASLQKRVAVIKDVYLYAEAIGVCCNPLWMAPWELLEEDGIDFERTREEIEEELHAKAVKKELPRYLTNRQEQRLAQEILDHIEEDGRWAGLAIMLFAGPRPSEARGIRYSDLVRFSDHPERRYIRMCRSTDADGNEKPHMKNRYGPRSVPEHIELQHILQKRENCMCEVSGDIDHLPVVCLENEYEKCCTAEQFGLFVKTQLTKLFDRNFWINVCMDTLTTRGDEPDGDEPTDRAEVIADKEITARLLRRNFATKNYAETRLEDDESRLMMGHKTDGKGYAPYSEARLWEMLQAMDHRMILPELHPGWHVRITDVATAPVHVADVGVQYISLAPEVLAQGVVLEIDVDLNESGDGLLLECMRRLPSGVEIVTDVRYAQSIRHNVGRINTDSIHHMLPWPRYEK